MITGKTITLTRWTFVGKVMSLLFSMPSRLVITFLPRSSVQFNSVAQSCPTLWLHEPQDTRPPCPSPIPRVHPNPCPLCQWCHPTVSSSVVPFSSRSQSFPASGSFQMSQLSASGGAGIGVSASASVPPMNTQECPLISWLQSPSSAILELENICKSISGLCIIHVIYITATNN